MSETATKSKSRPRRPGYITTNEAAECLTGHGICAVKDAINHTIDDCINNGYLVEILEKHRTEVFDVVLSEYNEEEYIRHEKELSLSVGRMEMLVDMVYSHDIPLDRAREKAATESNCDCAKFDSMLLSRHPDFVFPS